MPKFFGAWIDKAMPSCVFTPTQAKVFSLVELQSSPWYLECAKNYAPAEEEDEKKVAVAVSAPTTYDTLEEEDNDDAVVEILELTSTDKKRGKAKAVKSPLVGGSSRKAKHKLGESTTTTPALHQQLPPALDIPTVDRSHNQPSVRTVTFAPRNFKDKVLWEHEVLKLCLDRFVVRRMLFMYYFYDDYDFPYFIILNQVSLFISILIFYLIAIFYFFD